MNNSNIDEKALYISMLCAKLAILMFHLSEKEVKQYYGCDFEFDVEGENLIPVNLHTWIGKNHKYIEKYHKVFPVPNELRIPLLTPKKD